MTIMLIKVHLKDMGLKQCGGVFLHKCKEPAVLAGLPLQCPPASEGTKAQGSMKTLAAIHRSCSHMIASALVLPATADLE